MGPPAIGADGSRTFPLTVSEYVRDAVRQSQLQYAFHFSVMTNISYLLPSDVSSLEPILAGLKQLSPRCILPIQAIGTCSALSTTGLLQITIDSIMFNAGKSTSPSASTASPEATPSKHKRYGPRGGKYVLRV